MNKIRRFALLALVFILSLALQCVLFGPSRVNKAYMVLYFLFFIYHLLLLASVIIISPRVKTLAMQFMVSLLLPFVMSSLLGLGVYIVLDGQGGGVMEFLYVTLYAPYIETGGMIGSIAVALMFAIIIGR